MRLLLISNSTNAGEAYLEYPKENIKEFLTGIGRAVFIPYAAVTFSYDEYLSKVRARFSEIGIEVASVHTAKDPAETLRRAQAIIVGGGNTFHLLAAMQRHGLVDIISERVRDGVPYVGWSAGSNVACPTICTTNDMPIVEPDSFKAAGLIPFQINPHYLDANPQGHAGETRQQRIEEFVAANRGVTVAGLREGCMLRLEGDELTLTGPRPVRIFRYGHQPLEVNAGEDLGFLMRP